MTTVGMAKPFEDFCIVGVWRCCHEVPVGRHGGCRLARNCGPDRARAERRAGSGVRWGVRGAGVSQAEPHTRALTIQARAGGSPTETSGRVAFEHRSPAGINRFVGSVACLQRDAAGLVQLSGGVRQGETTAGEPLTGKDFAFTLDTAAHPQRFSSPRFANRGTIPPCGGGRAESVPVTLGMFRTGPL